MAQSLFIVGTGTPSIDIDDIGSVYPRYRIRVIDLTDAEAQGCLGELAVRAIVYGQTGQQRRIAKQFLQRANPSVQVLTFVHPSAVVSRFSVLGTGCFISRNVVVNPFAVVGEFTTIGESSIVEHDSSIAEYCTIGSSCAFGGSVTLNAYVIVGARVTINHGISIGGHARISDDSAVIGNLDAGARVGGVPHRQID